MNTYILIVPYKTASRAGSPKESILRNPLTIHCYMDSCISAYVRAFNFLT